MMQKAKDIMVRDVITVDPEAALSDVIKILIDKKISGMPVVNAVGKIVGIISEKDILNFIFSGNLCNTKVQEAMSKNITSFGPEDAIEKIALAIGEKQFRRVPVVENGKVVGIISRRDIIKIALAL